MKRQSIIMRDEAIRKRVLDILAAVSLEKPWFVEWGPYRKKRSLNQNALMHKWFEIVADFTGDTPDGVKETYKEMFLPRVPSKLGDGTRLKSTAELDTTEAKDFMDRVYIHATTVLGLYLPIPEDLGR